MTKKILMLSIFLVVVVVFVYLIDMSSSNRAQKELLDDSTEIFINGSERYQVIDGFGASGAWSMDPIGSEWSEPNKNKIADLLFSREKGIGLSVWRFNIGAGSDKTDQLIIKNPWRSVESFKENEEAEYDWSKQAGQQWFLNAAKERGVENFVAFVNSPPVWMTKNGHAQPDSQVGTTNLKPEYVDDFAIFLADVLEHFKNKGIDFKYVSPINEPTWDWNLAGQEGNRYSIEDIKAVVHALYQEIQARNLNTEIDVIEGVEYLAMLDDEKYAEFVGTESNYTSGVSDGRYGGKYREYIKELLGDSEIKEKIGNKISSHAYWSDQMEDSAGNDRLIRLRELLHDNINQYSSDAKFWMTEYCVLGADGHGRDLGMDTALRVARIIHYDLTKANASSWQWWTAVSKEDYKDGLIYTDYLSHGNEESIIESKLLWSFGNYSRFIRPGAYRVQLNGADNKLGLMGSAYIDEERKQLTTVFVNHGEEEELINFSFDSLPKGKEIQKLVPYVTSEENDLVEGDAISASDVYSVPAKSVVTFVGEF
ncbi:glycoside hydrolase [Aquibacillus albus]|uniref:O-glycosyl hydrolase n=1 Tax=Aquibacillus albus TaxID=1168171 RepID=A0ABS2N1T2_9BACI|nr:glycoside hydrolase [Aquibacillus albus]MBM7571860.1 O-glycosyl hydrolase [Aquibacillus albus]